MENPILLIDERIEESTKVKRSLSDEFKGTIVEVAKAIVDAHRKRKKVLVIGNGGSAADAQHFAGELIGRFLKEREAISVIALTTDSSTLTALANDYSLEIIFARQVEAHIQEGDILFAISTSGNSPNIVNAIAAAKKRSGLVVGLTGESGGAMADVCDLLLNVPSTQTPRIQETHIFVIHLICELVEWEICDE